MKKLLVVIAVFSLFCIPALAQDAPKVEVFGGYQLVHDSGENFDLDGFSYHGFTGAVEGNLASFLGIVGEFGYFRHTESAGGESATLSGIPFLFGPRVGYRGGKFRVFGHYLLGATRYSLDTTFEDFDWDWSETYFTQAIGGGIDIVLTDIISIRPAQIDLLSVRISEGGMSDWSNYFRYSGGVVFTFGR